MALVNKPDESIFASSAKQGEVDNFPDLLRGWGITFDQTQGIPPMEWFNFLFKRLDEKHTYLMQRGLPEWSATQDYTKGSCVQFDGVSYRALKNSKNNSPNESNSQYWVRWGFALSEIAQATLTQYGITKLYTGYDSQSEDLALTPKTAYQLKQLIDSNTRALGNVIPNSKKSSAVDSNSGDTVATSAAVKTAYDKGVEAKNAADNANSNANGRVSKSGDTITGQLNANSGVNTFARGADGFDRQWQNSTAPYLVDNDNANGNNAYYPFIKGINRNGNTWGTAFSFGYETPDGINKFGRGCIHLIEDNGTQKLWRFEHNGDFNSAGDVSTSSGKSLNNSVQISELVGEVAFFARTTPPSGWLKANGAAVSRITYATLFAAIGTTFGAGDGSSTFNLPDLRGEFARGLDDGRNVDGGRRLGTAQEDAIKTHTINVPNSQLEGNVIGSWFYSDRGNGNNNQPNNTITYTGEKETRPRNVALLACIKY